MTECLPWYAVTKMIRMHVQRRMTNADVGGMQCCIATSTSYLPPAYIARQHSAMHQYTSAQKDKWLLNRRDGSFIGNSDNYSKEGGELEPGEGL